MERRGQIVFINSSVGLRARAGVGQYAATKHALKALADSLREEVNASGVRVISVYPGQTASPMQADLYEAAQKIYTPERLLQASDVAEVVVCALSLPRSAEVTDIALRPMQSHG
jgi:NADP-dependent 3-hydroxy acid dehydrogenase YdfG